MVYKQSLLCVKPSLLSSAALRVAVLASLLARPSLVEAQGVSGSGGTTPDGPPPPPSVIYRKPYIKRFGRGAMVGGYMDHEFRMARSGAAFDQHRFIPFVYSAVTDEVHVSAEIEFEHGGFVAGDEETDGEIKIEYAVTDISLGEALNLRGGVVLAPLGSFNLLHDSPLNDLTERPLVCRQIIPTTLSESGAGIFGALYPSEMWTLSYEVYAVNGFNEGVLVNAGDSTRVDLRVREGRGSARTDNNNHRSVVARIGASPRLGTDLGLSVHSGAYDDAGGSRLTILAADARVRRGPVELLGEIARASADVPAAVAAFAATARRADGTPRAVAEAQAGYYAQANLHVGAGAWKRFPDSVWTLVGRLDRVDFDTDVDGDDTRAVSAGLNFRPVEDTVLKADVTWTWQRGEARADWGDAGRGGFLSMATYF
jgi:hypothetical protein